MEDLSKKQLRDIEDVAEILFNLENGVRISDLIDNPIFKGSEICVKEIEELIKELCMRNQSTRFSREISRELSTTCKKKINWRKKQGVIMQEIYNNEWLLRSAIYRYTEKHFSRKRHEIYLINEIVYQQFLINCYKNRGFVYRIKLTLTSKIDRIINIFENLIDDYQSF